MSPADELRTAAEKIRTHAEGAATGPWTVNGWGNIETANSEEVAEVWPLNNRDHNAAYVAVMHPGIGTALADWLETTADYATVSVGHPTHVTRAIAVARAINGSAP